jgi:hypothetical protein
VRKRLKDTPEQLAVMDQVWDLRARAFALVREGKDAAAIPLYREARELVRKMVGELPPKVEA